MNNAGMDARRTMEQQLLDILGEHRELESINRAIEERFGVRGVFGSMEDAAETRELLVQEGVPERTGPREYGDVQTSDRLADDVCDFLHNLGLRPQAIVEPTCGAGAFLRSAAARFTEAGRIYGVELQRRHVLRARIGMLEHTRHDGPRIEVYHDDIFTHRFPEDLFAGGEILILGNPPWVTSAELGGMGVASNVVKRNRDGMRGLEALTGRSNFDMGEAVIGHMLDRFAHMRGTLAMLCKNVVIRRLVESLLRRAWPVSAPAMYTIDAVREFGAAVDAGLLVLRLGERTERHLCTVAQFARPRETLRTFGWQKGRFVADCDAYAGSAPLDGASPFEWRQGVKHDCARVMELRCEKGAVLNGYGERLDVEPDYLYPFLKSSDLRSFEVAASSRLLILPQRHIGEATEGIERQAPKLWRYLHQHREHFEGRRSRVYHSAPTFAVFGVGDYSFLPYKVAISGLYKHPRIALVPPIAGKPVMFDDTCYMLGFERYADALFTATLLHHERIRLLLKAITFNDAKRPYTKRVLMRIDLAAAAGMITWEELCELWEKVGYVPGDEVTAAEYERYREGMREKL